ncbi:hypothetical protein CEXT_740521 [Caerostris extrusa]|uniref:Uncharacterized protein n=1 Tax=Caerostris extrusa TaxID=172846 RepID=A0AAV4YG61_CAEEX|nr:hypothetical protein CEXT_740521 [Caerostris extrusa]
MMIKIYFSDDLARCKNHPPILATLFPNLTFSTCDLFKDGVTVAPFPSTREESRRNLRMTIYLGARWSFNGHPADHLSGRRGRSDNLSGTFSTGRVGLLESKETGERNER